MATSNNQTDRLQDHIDIKHWAEQMLAAKTKQQPYPRVTDAHADLNLATAYAIQHAFIELCVAQGEKVSGYKAALTAPAAQAAMGIDSPIVGALFDNGSWAYDNGSAAVTLEQIPKLILETELGFTLKQEVLEPLTGTEQLKEITATCHPMIELACLGFGDLTPSGADLVASNSASKCYVQGAAWDWQAVDLDTLAVSLSRDSDPLHATSSGSVLAGQWQALLWLVNTTVANGHPIQPGQILMTGSIGGLHPAKPGSHQASYGAAGEITLTVA